MLAEDYPIKVMWDGIMDSSELYHRYNLTLGRVLDLQLADVGSRQIEGEGEDEQFRRLTGPVKPGELRASANCYKQVHRLNSLDKCAEEHKVELPPTISALVHASWKMRPLPQQLINYAARDVVLIARIFKRFEENNYLPRVLLFEQSRRYIQIHHNTIPRTGDRYKEHCFLLLDILNEPPLGRTLTCNCCGRSLSHGDCFSAAGQRLVKQRNCWVCRAVKVRGSAWRDRREDSDYEDYTYDSSDASFSGGLFNDSYYSD